MPKLIQLLPPGTEAPQGAVPPGPETVSRSMKPTTLFGANADGAATAEANVMVMVVVGAPGRTSVPVRSIVPVLKVSPTGSGISPACAGKAGTSQSPSNRTAIRQGERLSM